jgi:hypothetical protein
MRRILFTSASLVTLALAACSETTQDVTSPDFQISAIKNPTPTFNPNGPVWVHGDFALSFTISGTAGINAHPQGLGRCGDPNATPAEDANVWYQPGSDKATNAPFCSGGSGITVASTCHIDEDGLPATYAFGTGGQGAPVADQTTTNENINFHSNLIQQDTAQFVHYGAPTKTLKKGITTSKSWTAFTFTCDNDNVGDGYINLSLWNPYTGNLFRSGEVNVADRKLVNSQINPTVDDVFLYGAGEGPEGVTTGATGTYFASAKMGDLSWFYRSRN